MVDREGSGPTVDQLFRALLRLDGVEMPTSPDPFTSDEDFAKVFFSLGTERQPDFRCLDNLKVLENVRHTFGFDTAFDTDIGQILILDSAGEFHIQVRGNGHDLTYIVNEEGRPPLEAREGFPSYSDLFCAIGNALA